MQIEKNKNKKELWDFRGKQDQLTKGRGRIQFMHTFRIQFQLQLLHEIARTSLRSDTEPQSTSTGIDWLMLSKLAVLWEEVTGQHVVHRSIQHFSKDWGLPEGTVTELRLWIRRREVFGCGLGEWILSWESQGSEGQLQEAPRRPTTPLLGDAEMKCWQDGETSVRGGPPASGPAALPEVQQCPLQVG